MEKPARIFDREFEWRQLATFAARVPSRPLLGVVSGRRRQGKTFLLEALARETGGMYFGADRGDRGGVFAALRRRARGLSGQAGAVRWGERMGAGHVERLRRARDLLTDRGFDTSVTKLVCYGGAGFDESMAAVPDRDRVLPVGLDDLYRLAR